jgi:hypothetical protein
MDTQTGGTRLIVDQQQIDRLNTLFNKLEITREETLKHIPFGDSYELNISKNIEEKIAKGVKTYMNIIEMLSNFEISFYSFQYVFIRKCLTALIPKMFGVKVYEEHEELIKRKLCLADERLKQFLAFFAQRRSGKTLVLAHVCVAACLNIDGDGYNDFRIMVFAHRSGSAKDFIKECSKVIRSLKNVSEYTIDEFTTQIIMKHKKTGQLKIIRCVSGFNPDTARGFGADVIIVDEASFLPIETFISAIFPVSSVNGTALICISSPSGSSKGFALMMNFNDPKYGKLFDSHHFTGVCDACKDKKLKVAICPHTKMGDISVPHKSSLIKKMLAGLYEHLGQHDANLRENEGIVTDDFTYAFNSEKLSCLDDPYEIHNENLNQIPALFLNIDPNGGGINETALSIGYLNNIRGDVVILWLDKSRCENYDQIRTFILSNLSSFYETPAFKKFMEVQIIVSTESNGAGCIGGAVHSYIAEFVLKKYPQLRKKMFFTSDGVKTGWVKNPYNTVKYILDAQNLFDNRKIFVHPSLSTFDRDYEGTRVVRSVKRDFMIKELKEQLGRFQNPDTVNLTNDYCRYKKFNGKGNGSKNDDLAIVVLMLCHFSRLYTLGGDIPFNLMGIDE